MRDPAAFQQATGLPLTQFAGMDAIFFTNDPFQLAGQVPDVELGSLELAITGDLFRKDEEGYYWFVARGDDMIISSGYNIAAIEVESVLLTNEAVAECAVVGLPDEERGMLVCAYIVVKETFKASDALKLTIQQWFKEVAAPYKYPRVIHFVAALPKTETGKIQRFKLKSSE